MSRLKLAGFAVASGVLIALANPSMLVPDPSPWPGWLAWIMLVPWFTALLRGASMWQGAWSGYLMGAVAWALHFYWVLGVPYLGWGTVVMWVGPTLVWSVYPAVFGAGAVWLARQAYRMKGGVPQAPQKPVVSPRHTDQERGPTIHNFTSSQRDTSGSNPSEREPHGTLVYLVVLPTWWVVNEWCQNPLFHLPWHIGMPLYAHPSLTQGAALGGVMIVSFVVAAFNIGLAAWWAKVPSRMAVTACGIGLAVLNGGWGMWRLQAVEGRLAASPRRVAVVQGAFPMEMRRNPKHTLSVLDVYVRLARDAAGSKPDLIIWPEAAAPGLLRFHPIGWPRVAAMARETRVPQILGFDDALLDDRGYPTHFFNTAWLLNTEGVLTQVYQKRFLYPLGECIPWKGSGVFERFFVGVQELTPGPSRALFDTPVGRAAIPICNEIFFTEDLRDWVNQGAEIIITLTNDTWFGKTSEPTITLSRAVIRAVEHGRWLVRASDSGISAVISPTGRLKTMIPLFQRGFTTCVLDVQPVDTLYLRWGHAWLVVAVLISVLIMVQAKVDKALGR